MHSLFRNSWAHIDPSKGFYVRSSIHRGPLLAPSCRLRTSSASLEQQLKGAAYLPPERMQDSRCVEDSSSRASHNPVSTSVHLYGSQTVCTVKVMLFNRGTG